MENFPYKEELIHALNAGVRCRKGERALFAGDLVGTYRIRLRIAQDSRTKGEITESSYPAIRDLTTIVKNLDIPKDTEIAVYYIGPTHAKAHYSLIECEQTGTYVGCMRGVVQAEEG